MNCTLHLRLAPVPGMLQFLSGRGHWAPFSSSCQGRNPFALKSGMEIEGAGSSAQCESPDCTPDYDWKERQPQQ